MAMYRAGDNGGRVEGRVGSTKAMAAAVRGPASGWPELWSRCGWRQTEATDPGVVWGTGMGQQGSGTFQGPGNPTLAVGGLQLTLSPIHWPGKAVPWPGGAQMPSAGLRGSLAKAKSGARSGSPGGEQGK